MAKSLRSKRKRKMRAIKRVRYAVKELTKLKEVLATGGEELDEIATMTTPDTVKKMGSNAAERVDAGNEGEADAVMEVDQEKREYNKQLLDKHGNYPVWMSQRQMRKRKILRKKGKVVKPQKHQKKKK